MRCLLAMVAALAAAGCTAPGEPPAHPSQAEYGDLMRRETDKAVTSLATMQRVFAWVAKDKITSNYATVTARQAIADLTGVSTDLRQVTAPTAGSQRAQDSMRKLVVRESARIDRTLHALGDAAVVMRTNKQLEQAASQAEALGTKLG